MDREKAKGAYGDSGYRYGARKIWHELRRKDHDIARCTVERLMHAMEIQGVVRVQEPIMTNPDTSRPCLGEKVNRDFTPRMPNHLGVSPRCTIRPTEQGLNQEPRSHWIKVAGNVRSH